MQFLIQFLWQITHQKKNVKWNTKSVSSIFVCMRAKKSAAKSMMVNCSTLTEITWCLDQFVHTIFRLRHYELNSFLNWRTRILFKCENCSRKYEQIGVFYWKPLFQQLISNLILWIQNYPNFLANQTIFAIKKQLNT